MGFLQFKQWLPLGNFSPAAIFLKKLIPKWFFTSKNLILILGSNLGFYGAKVLGTTLSGNTLVKLNKNYAVGKKGFILELPRDQVIFSSIRKNGEWELNESEFLAVGLNKICLKYNLKTALLDIGANTGLVTLQTMNISATNNSVFLFEPIPRHTIAIKHNLLNLSKTNNIHINEFALSDRNGNSDIYTDAFNHGHTTLLKSLVNQNKRIETNIRLVDTNEYCNNFLSGFDGYVIKCDTQGMDALILSRLPINIWFSTERAVIEVWALPEINVQDVDKLLTMWTNLDFSWTSDFRIRIGLNEIRDFWLSNSGLSKNLFLTKQFNTD